MKMCEFMNDGKPGPCGKLPTYFLRFKKKKRKHMLCKFHAVFMASTNYGEDYQVRRAPGGKEK